MKTNLGRKQRITPCQYQMRYAQSGRQVPCTLCFCASSPALDPVLALEVAGGVDTKDRDCDGGCSPPGNAADALYLPSHVSVPRAVHYVHVV